MLRLVPTIDSFPAHVQPALSSFAFAEAEAVWPTLASLEAIYPGFASWYFGKVVPGVATGQRRILRAGSASEPVGIAILKRDAIEAKICTLWVAEGQRHTGLGRDLMEEAIEWCRTPQPLFTVPAEQIGAFEPLVKRFGFDETARIRSLYRPGVVEHIFNGQIRPTLNS